MSIVRGIAFVISLPFVLIGLPLMAFACGIRIKGSDSISDMCRKLS